MTVRSWALCNLGRAGAGVQQSCHLTGMTGMTGIRDEAEPSACVSARTGGTGGGEQARTGDWIRLSKTGSTPLL